LVATRSLLHGAQIYAPATPFSDAWIEIQVLATVAMAMIDTGTEHPGKPWNSY